MHGKGTKTYSNGVIEEGEWRDDWFIKLHHLDASMPESYSLEKYCPKAISQGQNPFCVTYSISTIATIIYAKEKGITDQMQISENRFSPTFLHYIFPESVDPKYSATLVNLFHIMVCHL